MASLREEIFQLTNPTPVFRDPEDNLDDETAAKLAEHGEEDVVDVSHASALRKRNALLLSDTDKRYAGQRTSRKNIDDYESDDQSKMSEDDEDQDEDDDSDIEGESEDSDAQIEDNQSDGDNENDNITAFKRAIGKADKEFSFEDDGDYSKYADDYSNESSHDDDNDIDDDDSDVDNEDDDVDDDDEGNNDEDDSDEDEEEGIQQFSSSSKDEMAKGLAAKQQLGLWDSLLEGRIKVQKAVSLVNQLPQTDTWTQFTNTSQQFANEASKTEQVLQHVLESLVHLQELLQAQNTDTRKFVTGQDNSNEQAHLPRPEEDSDEEIPSDSDEEMTEKPTPAPPIQLGKRKLKMNDYPGFLKKHHEQFKSYRDNTIQKWYDKTRLASGKVKGKSFSAFDQSALVQINQILGDKDRLVRRSQLKRSAYRVLGMVPKPQQPEITPTEEMEDEPVLPSADEEKDYDVEIFDDDDFYHQMLRELIEKKTTDVNDPVALSRQWLEIQRLRSKNKKKVDTKASKGRKVRYNVHKKLVNFMAPVDNCEWTDEARDDLFKSLFGKRFGNGTGA
ncbi:protein AATF-like [Mya arenaria]|uniref:protein AATF-like n=1 Tax=Mya arenaria TaxID=6604 RepID=UPI0022E46147|nr:protein AATF-like [Mya arenaria]